MAPFLHTSQVSVLGIERDGNEKNEDDCDNDDSRDDNDR